MRILYGLAIALIVLLWMFWPLPARSQMPQPKCGGVADFETMLRDKYQEAPAFAGKLPDNVTAFLAISPDGKTWSFYIRKDTIACMILSGEFGQMIDHPETSF